MSATRAASWTYCEEFHAEDETLLRARYRAEELGCDPVSPGVGAFLRVQAATVHAKTVVEIGTGTGVSGTWLLRGMPTDGVLTTIDQQTETGRAARETFAEAGVRTNRTRLITGVAADVLPRLSDAAYDLVFLDADKECLQLYVKQAERLLRPGGALLIHGALWKDRVADPARRDHLTTAIRDLGRALRDEAPLHTAMVPLGDGVLTCARH